MTWEKVEGGGQGRTAAGPKISLRKSGSIGINNAALEEHFTDTQAVVVMWDSENRKIGFKRLEDKDEDDNSYTLSRSDSGGAVTPQSFLNSNDLVPDVTTQYRPEIEAVNQNLELVVIDLDDPLGTYGTPDEEQEEAEGEDDS